MKKPLIFDIKRTSTVDGPGIRTTVFFKGCNMDCFWCHNPEGKLATTQVGFFLEKCISCGTCQSVCQFKTKCENCGSCVQHCPVQARKLYGHNYELEELLTIISADKAYYDATGGGVTFSGGECMLYPEFLAEVARECQNRGISVAVDTAGNVPFSSFEMVLPFVDLFLYDIKCLNSRLHRKGTGVNNQLILENLQRLIDYKKKILIRITAIPGFNEGEEVERVQEYCKQYELPFEVLKYHETGESKKNALDVFAKIEDNRFIKS